MKLRSLKPVDIKPREYVKPSLRKQICIFDCETDPFGYDLTIAPFTCDFFDGTTHVEFWGDDCIAQFADYMETRRDDDLLIFAHNLGGFDIHFLYDYFDDGMTPLIIGSRIAKATIFGQEFRDSYKIFAAPLSAHKKDEFDYSKMLRERREKYRAEIMEYQRHDCEYLYEIVTGFFDTFGDRITIGNTAINVLQSTQGFQRMIEKQDDRIRPYFIGGRNQCFEAGVLVDDWKIYDVNSMYPFVMANFQHPISSKINTSKRIGPQTAFAHIEATNDGVLGQRGPMGELDFTCERGDFWATIHEINAGLELGLLRIHRVIEAIDFDQWGNFAEFVDTYYKLRLEAKANGDDLQSQYYKLLLNNAYGKFAQDPRRYGDFAFTKSWAVPNGGHFHAENNPAGWSPKYTNRDKVIWNRIDPHSRKNFFNVATGASITGAARARLLHGISCAERPVYCDTDSIICRRFSGDDDPKRLGAWKREAEGRTLAIAGKKMYALLAEDGTTVKQASKGVGLSAEEIFAVARGEVVTYRAKQPTFNLDGTQTPLTREIRRTT